MITTLAGANDFARQAKLTDLIAQFVAAQGSDIGLERLDGSEVSLERLSEALTSLPFLADRKLVVLANASANKQFAEKFEELLSGLPETTDLVLVEAKIDRRSKLFNYLKKTTNFNDFPELDAPKLASWLVAEAKQRGGQLRSADASYLVNRVGANQQLLNNELNKLLLYNANIDRSAIDLMTEPAPQSTVFELLDAAFNGQTKRALDIYGEQRALKVEPQQIIAMLAWQLHVLALCKTAAERSADQIAADAKISPYVVRKSLPLANKLSLPQLKKLLADLISIDVRLKSESLDVDAALQHYLLTLST